MENLISGRTQTNAKNKNWGLAEKTNVISTGRFEEIVRIHDGNIITSQQI